MLNNPYSVTEVEVRDDLDRAVEYFTAHPDKIYLLWSCPTMGPHGCLFMWLGDPWDDGCSCPVQVYAGHLVTREYSGIVAFMQPRTSGFPALDEYIQNLKDFPTKGTEIRVEHLPEFARIQRMYRRLKSGKTIDTVVAKREAAGSQVAQEEPEAELCVAFGSGCLATVS